MTAVLVHGVPETGRLWDKLRAHLSAQSVALDLPGFGAPRPDGFGATADEYVDWLASRVRNLDGPVDLVGHDWGALLVVGVVATRSAAVRSWAIDVASVLHPDYVWHDIARMWQTPGVGEEWLRTTLENPHTVAPQLAATGVPDADAELMAEQFDEPMGRSILDMYRSATPNVHAGWAAKLSSPVATPGLVLQPSLDPFDDLAAAGEMATRLGARAHRLDGLGHWWMLEDPATTATALQQFWASAG